jgi:hypothetical protein
MSTWLEQQIAKAAGKAGKAIDVVGKATNNFSLGTGVKLPELNISERLQSYGGYIASKNPINPPSVGAADNPINWGPSQETAPWNQPGTTTTKVATTGGTGDTGGGNGDYGIGQQTSDFGAMIDQDYEIAMGSLGQQEQSLQSQGDLAQAQIANEGAASQTSLGAEQATKEASAQTNLATGEKSATTGMQNARDIWRQVSQQNIAQLSGAGISSSSVAEAMMETLGVETARRIAGITGSLSEIRQNVTQELGRIKGFYAEKKTQIQESIRIETGKIQQALIQGLNQINTAKQQAASDKAQRRQELMVNAQNALTSLKTQEQQFSQSLQQWAAQKSSALSSVLNQDTFNSMMQKQYGVLSQQYNPSQFNITPQQQMSPTGEWSGSYNVEPKKEGTEPDWVKFPNDGFSN